MELLTTFKEKEKLLNGKEIYSKLGRLYEKACKGNPDASLALLIFTNDIFARHCNMTLLTCNSDLFQDAYNNYMSSLRDCQPKILAHAQ